MDIFSVKDDDSGRYLRGPEWCWSCDNDSLIKMEIEIGMFPLLPYAAIARAICLHRRGDQRWKDDAVRIHELLQNLRIIVPRVPTIDYFAALYEELFETEGSNRDLS
jgi:hypothetical protein